MNVAHTAKVLIGKALRPVHAGEEKLITLQREMLPARDMIVHSESFALGAAIPRRHAAPGEGDNISPSLSWSGVPPQTRELILVCEDPDAPALHPFIHWVVRRIPPEQHDLPEGIPVLRVPTTAPGLLQGINAANKVGWFGPLPPPGHGPHHYYFQLFALDHEIDLPDAPSQRDLIHGMSGHLLAHGHYVGTYERR
jgi:Raf kinase inhibitor-like YbhB/YbcL family protein